MASRAAPSTIFAASIAALVGAALACSDGSPYDCVSCRNQDTASGGKPAGASVCGTKSYSAKSQSAAEDACNKDGCTALGECHGRCTCTLHSDAPPAGSPPPP